MRDFVEKKFFAVLLEISRLLDNKDLLDGGGELADGELDRGDLHQLDRGNGLLLRARGFVGAVDAGVGEKESRTRVVVGIREAGVVEIL